jgi:hypothetical protein
LTDLPYAFDLLYDIKTKHELMFKLYRLMLDVEDIMETINDYDIVFTKEEQDSLVKINTVITQRITKGITHGA